MKRLLLLTVIMLFPFFLHSQNDTLLFSEAIKIDLKKYKRESALAYRKGDFEKGKFLFDSLVDNRLTGTLFDNFAFKKTRYNYYLRLMVCNQPGGNTGLK